MFLICELFAERGVALITRFLDKVRDEDSRQDLVQVRQYYLQKMPNLNKENLARSL